MFHIRLVLFWNVWISFLTCLWVWNIKLKCCLFALMLTWVQLTQLSFYFRLLLYRSNLPFFSTPTGTIQRVTSFKWLGLQIDSSLSWANHTTIIIQKASRRLYFPKQLKRAGLATHHLLDFYITVTTCTWILCTFMALCPHKAQTQELEAIQKRAIHIIFHFTRGMPYSYMLDATNLSSLSSRRDDLSRNFFSILLILHPVCIISFPTPI